MLLIKAKAMKTVRAKKGKQTTSKEDTGEMYNR